MLDIKPIRYFYRSSTHDHITYNERNLFFFKPLNNSFNTHGHRNDIEIKIDPHTFKQKE